MEPSSKKIIEKLLRSGVLSKEKYHGALQHYNNYGGSIEEAIIEAGALDEDTLLKNLASIYKTRYVSTEKLKKADIPQNILKMVPHKFAEKHQVFPILFDNKTRALSLVSINPNDLNVETELTHVAKVPQIKFFVARPAAIKAAISKFYKGDIHAFANLDKDGFKEFHSMMDVYERNLLDEGTMAAALAGQSMSRERTISASEIDRSQKAGNTSGQIAGTETARVVEILKVMLSLLESNRPDLSGHSVLAASQTEKMCMRVKLSPNETNAITMAALLHDLGKGNPYHLTPFNVAEWDGHKTTALKRYENPIRLFESVKIPNETIASLRHMYERADGKGFPSNQKGQDIPLGARIISLADTFADLTSNPRNPYRRILSTEEAVKILKQSKGKIFDPNLTDLFGIVVTGDDIKRQLLTGAPTILLIDSDPEQCAILDWQLTSREFKTRSERTADAAVKTIIELGADIILSEVDLEPFDGFELKKRLNDNPKTAKIPFIYYTANSEASSVEKGFELGAADYLVKPSSLQILVAKIQKTLKQSTSSGKIGGVSGSLKEMSLPDLVQILSHGRKNGSLKLNIRNVRGEIHFVNGEIHNALYGNSRGESAFFEMLKYKDGSFSLDPDFKTESRVINMTAEMLLLEGMRRLDESSR